MRVLLVTDMEGISWITDHRECWPCFPEYWRSGRRRMTDDVVAAARGLLDGGATHVLVQNGHGAGDWPNILADEYPDGCEPLGDRPVDQGFDAHFHVGCHARCGTRDGFVSHTHVPDFRMEVDGRLITECHFNAWTTGTPLLGVTGDAALGPQLDGALAGTPFLSVKRSSSRTTTAPANESPDRSATAIQAFARQCAMRYEERKSATLPNQFTVRFAIDGAAAGAAEGEAGLVRESPSVLAVGAGDWARDVLPAWRAAINAGFEPLRPFIEGLDLSSEAAMERQDPVELERYRRFWIDWVNAEFEPWVQ